MTFSRRSFLGGSVSIGGLATFLAHPEIAEAIGTGPQPSTAQTAGEVYWKNLYAGSSQVTLGGSKSPNSARDPRIAQYDDKAGFRWAEDIKVSELPSFDEDAVITLELAGFRAGSQDRSNLAKVRFAQLHLSCQRVTGSEFLGPIVWASLATLFTSKASNLPAEKDLTWNALAGNTEKEAAEQSDTSRLSHVVLNQGAGRMSINITTTPTSSLLDKILGGLIRGTTILTPLLGFPGIALDALRNFYIFYGQLERSLPENFLLNSEQQDVAVTQEGVDNSLISADALKLVSGSYILVPKSQEDDLQKEMDQLVIQNGYLVKRGSKASPDDRVSEAVPTVSYATLNVKVQKASDFPATSKVTDSLLDSPSESDHSSGAKKSH